MLKNVRLEEVRSHTLLTSFEGVVQETRMRALSPLAQFLTTSSVWFT